METGNYTGRIFRMKKCVLYTKCGFHPAESGREIIRIRVRERCSSKKCSRSCRYLRRARFSGFGHAPLRRGLEALLALPVGQFGMRETDRVVADDVSAQALGFGKQ